MPEVNLILISKPEYYVFNLIISIFFYTRQTFTNDIFMYIYSVRLGLYVDIADNSHQDNMSHIKAMSFT